MAVGDVVAEAMVLVVLTVVNEGLDLEDESESDGELTPLPEPLLLDEIWGLIEESVPEVLGFAAIDFLQRNIQNYCVEIPRRLYVTRNVFTLLNIYQSKRN